MVAKRIIPCLDVKGGRTVKGINFEGLRDVGDAVELGSYYARSGADELVYLDISATREERGTFTRLVERIADEINIPFTVGGGIGSVEDASRLLDAGADKISINSAAIASPSLIDSIASRYGNQFVIVAIDARMMEDGTWRATTHGGTRPTDKELFSWAHEAQERAFGRYALHSRHRLGRRGIGGRHSGRAYEGPCRCGSGGQHIPLRRDHDRRSEETVEANEYKCKDMTFDQFNLGKCPDGLLPVIVQDAVTLKVLMLGYMNREAFERSVAEGRVTFFSRTRQCLWTKGETSGHYLYIESMYADCDGDTLLIKARPVGPTCHRGTTSCFDTPDEEGFIRRLQSVVQQRHRDMPEGSYTTKLFIKGVKKISQKVGEEAVESIVEAVDGNRDRFIYEASDLIYHLLVLMEQMGCSIEDMERELALRHK